MKFSIIMPVYNAENYVNKGIMSIICSFSLDHIDLASEHKK